MQYAHIGKDYATRTNAFAGFITTPLNELKGAKDLNIKFLFPIDEAYENGEFEKVIAEHRLVLFTFEEFSDDSGEIVGQAISGINLQPELVPILGGHPNSVTVEYFRQIGKQASTFEVITKKFDASTPGASNLNINSANNLSVEAMRRIALHMFEIGKATTSIPSIPPIEPTRVSRPSAASAAAPPPSAAVPKSPAPAAAKTGLLGAVRSLFGK